MTLTAEKNLYHRYYINCIYNIIRPEFNKLHPCRQEAYQGYYDEPAPCSLYGLAEEIAEILEDEGLQASRENIIGIFAEIA